MDWVAPVLVISASLWSQNPMAVNIALNMMANYACDLFKGLKGDPKVKLTILHAQENKKTSKKIHYEGPASGLASLTDILSSFNSQDKD